MTLAMLPFCQGAAAPSICSSHSVLLVKPANACHRRALRLAQNRKDALVVVGHPQPQLRNQMSADVNAALNFQLDRVLRGQSIAEGRVVGRAATGPYPLRLGEQVG